MLDSLHKKHFVFLLGYFNVDLSPDIETTAAVEEFKNIFCSHHLYPLINKPTREAKSSKTIIDIIYCNIPHLINISNIGIICTYISAHHAILCLFNETNLQYYIQNTTTKRSEKNIAQFSHNLKKETWDIVYEESTQVAFTWFQGVIYLFIDKGFQKLLFIMTYQNRSPWMTDEMLTRITTKINSVIRFTSIRKTLI